MGWTKERPTKPGWYWYKGGYDAKNEYKPINPVVTYVGDKLVPWQPFMDYDDYSNSMDGEWLGPIEEPK